MLKLSGDAQKGHGVFSSVCMACHRIGLEGADLAPGLGDVGTRLSKADIYKSILEPSASITLGFETYAIRLNSGVVLTGLIGAQNDTEVTLRLDAANSKTIKRTDIGLMKKQDKSLMPDGLGVTIGAQGLADLAAFLAAPFPPAPAKLALNPHEHIAIIGNTLADRMQHDGTLEALIHKAYPQNDLVFRNLGFAGDEIETRYRSESFGSPEEWLGRVKADVVLAFFGFNESFNGPAGLGKFRADLDKFIKATKAANYSGKGTPRLVLFSPIAQEKMKDSNQPDPQANNANILLYTAAMAEIARANAVQFVDLFAASQTLYAVETLPLTFNSLHLTIEGYQALAPVMFKAMLGVDAPPVDPELTKIREVVRDRNEMWFSRYRTVDGYNVYGGRSLLTFNGVNNQKTMQEEMVVRDAMTANREKRVWGVARGYDQKVDDSNLPAITPVVTNKPNPPPYLEAEKAIESMIVPKGVKINLFASEEQYPDLIKPVQMAWDTKGRLWVSVWRTYPERTPGDPQGDSILIFEDTKGTGKADKCTTYITGLNSPTGFQFFKDGILLMQAPDLWQIETDKATGKAGKMERVLNGMDSADSHHTTNAMALDPGGATFLSDGVFHRTQVETAEGPVRNMDAAIFRYEPLSHKFERYAPYNFANPHGRVFDRWGNDYITDATGNSNYFGPAFSGHLDGLVKHDNLKNFWPNPSRPCPGTGILSSRAWPEEYEGNFLNCNVIGFQGVYRAKIIEDGSGMKGVSLENMISSKDPNFRPTQAITGPDGAVYVADWSNVIIGHMQHHIRDPNRDHTHGRIYRLTYEGKTTTPAKIDGEPIEALLALLKEPENATRELAKVELGKHDSAQVVAAVDKWIAGFDKNDANYARLLTEALWVKQWHNVVDTALLKQQLRSPDYHSRFAATRVLCYQRDRIPDALELLKAQVADEHPRVRLEAVRALSFFRRWEAADIALNVLKQPMDYYLDYCLKETMKQLEPWWKKALNDGAPMTTDNPKGVDYILANVSTADLAKMPKTTMVYNAMLTRADSSQPMRLEALGVIAKEKNVPVVNVLLETLQRHDKADSASSDLSNILLIQPAADLKAAHAELVKFTDPAKTEMVRCTAIAALMIADGSTEGAWSAAQKSPKALKEFLVALPLIPDVALRATAYDKVSQVAAALPPEIADSLAKSHGTSGRFVRIELPRTGTMTLAEVEVFSGMKNIAPSGKAKQSTTGYGAEAQRAIDGNTNGEFGAGTSTHTQENDPHPWWEVDLQKELPIEALVVWPRTDGNGQFASRLDGFDLIVLDAARHEVFRKGGNPGPKEAARFELAGDSPIGIQGLAIGALLSTRKEPQSVFKLLVTLMDKPALIDAAAAGMLQLPRESWSKDLAEPAISKILAWARSVPVSGRTAPDYVKTLHAGMELTALLAPQDAAKARHDLREVTVNVFSLSTVREQMHYDSTRLVVEPNKPFEVVFENGDMMPHNLVFVLPGARQEVAEAAQTMRPDQLDGQGRAFMPQNPKIFGGSKLVQPGQRETLHLTSPAQEGDCEYVCTFPGHWTIMWGTLVVTKDVEAYLAAHPTPPPQAIGPAVHVHNH